MGRFVPPLTRRRVRAPTNLSPPWKAAAAAAPPAAGETALLSLPAPAARHAIRAPVSPACACSVRPLAPFPTLSRFFFLGPLSRSRPLPLSNFSGHHQNFCGLPVTCHRFPKSGGQLARGGARDVCRGECLRVARSSVHRAASYWRSAAAAGKEPLSLGGGSLCVCSRLSNN